MLSYSDFDKSKVLPKNVPLRVYGVLGDGFLQKRVTDALLEWLLPPDARDFNLDRIDGVTSNLTDVLGRCSNLPFLADVRVVWVERADKLEGLGRGGDDQESDELDENQDKNTSTATPKSKPTGKGAKTSKAEDASLASEKRFIAALKTLPETTVLILSRTPEIFDVSARKKPKRCVSARVDKAIEPSPSKANKKETSENVPGVISGLIIDCSVDSKSIDMVNRIVEAEAVNRNIPLARNAAKFLVERVGVNLEQLISELEKCAARVGVGEFVTPAIIQEMVRPTLQDTIFTLTDAIGQKRTPHALGVLRELMEAGFKPEQILATLVPHLRLLLQAKALQDAGIRISAEMASYTPPALVNQLPTEKDNILNLAAAPNQLWRINKMANQARNFSTEQIQAALEAALAADLGMKGIEGDGGGKAEDVNKMLLELTVLNFGE